MRYDDANILGGSLGGRPGERGFFHRFMRYWLPVIVYLTVIFSLSAQPNLKLRRVLDRFGFVIRDVAGVGSAFHHVHRVRLG